MHQWISTKERLPSIKDANYFGEVWWWVPRYAPHPQLDFWDHPEMATHWLYSPSVYTVTEDLPPPPTETTCHSRDEG